MKGGLSSGRPGRALFMSLVGSLVVSLGSPVTAIAQGGPPPQRRNAASMDAERTEMERRFQARLDTIVRERLQLTDEQFTKLRDVASRTESVRRALRRDEYTARYALRRELMAGARASETRVAEILDQMPKLEQRKLDLLETEQRELATFLTAIQRARYFALQDELRRSMQELQRNRMERRDTVPGGDSSSVVRRRGPPPTH